ncbi:response regulator [Nocardia sp. NPDC058058]|uniref:response regulator n=1 Tax=Nocardia sp. NPDC058058 TaxID=3346317 RepID=UPI0036DE8F14
MNTHQLCGRRAAHPLIPASQHEGPALGRVFLLEQHEPSAAAIVGALSGAGYDALHTMDARQGVEIAHWWRPDLVVLSLSTPDPGELDVCRRLHAALRIPIFIRCPQPDPAAVSAAIDAGACDYLPGPLRTGELLNRIRVRLHPQA